MIRSLWKGVFIDNHLLNIKEKEEKIIKIYSRRSIIFPYFVNKKVNIYNGNKFVTIKVTNEMIGHKFGEFAQTRQIYAFKKKKKK
jgi:small subunit ribosomal protein S19